LIIKNPKLRKLCEVCFDFVVPADMTEERNICKKCKIRIDNYKKERLKEEK